MTVDAPPADVSIAAADPPPPGEPVERRPMPGGVFVAFASITSLSAILIFLVVYAVGFSALQEQRSQHQLYASYRGLLDPSSPIAPKVGGVINPGSPVALLNAPQGGLHNLIVVEGTSSSDLLKGPGHLRDSPLPGQVGQSLILGKSLTAGAPFHDITHLPIGAVITVTTGQSTFRFTVIDHRVGGDQLPVVPTGGALLTLATSYGTGTLGRFAPSHVVYVDATLQGKPVVSPAGRPVAVPVAELPGRNDPGAWLFVVLWLQALILVGAASVWAWMRWSRWQTWLVAAPVLLGVVWGVAGQAMSLLPNVV